MTQKEQPLVLDRQVNVTYELTGEPFEHLESQGIPRALELTLQADRQPATMPELVGYRTNNHDPRLWNTWFDAMSEEDVGPNPQKIKLNTTDPVYVLAHGDAAILRTPERIRKAFDDGLTPQYAAKFGEPELNLVLSGHDGQFPVLTIDEFLEETESNPRFDQETRSYVIVAPLTRMQSTPSGYQKIEALQGNELVAVRAGSKAQANAFLDKAAEIYDTKKLGNWHPFNDIDSEERQGRLLFLSYYYFNGLLGINYLLSFSGRFLGIVKLKKVGTFIFFF